MKTLIVVPARYGSTRFPGKPLAEIAGRSMVERVAVRARAAAAALDEARYVVATDDQRIFDHCANAGLEAVMTPSDVPSGSDRALAAAKALNETPDIVVNLQGDAPFTPIEHITAIVDRLAETGAEAATPVIQLDWEALDRLRAQKETTPFSGTTCVMDQTGRAIWFSKTILPALRKEGALRAAGPLSPIHRHIGLYAYRRAALERFVALPPSHYEQLEGLEQLRLLENGMQIACAVVSPGAVSTSGVDAPEDVVRLETLIEAHGEDPDAAFF